MKTINTIIILSTTALIFANLILWQSTILYFVAIAMSVVSAYLSTKE
ncbi:hypothetical protein LJC13_03255 [Peptostreptococcaceae bacterium OttesenSCG-928-C18]|nr:hypothetical protein [Peptostreptococcaceae bacterium OttesenSCG-928-C18]